MLDQTLVSRCFRWDIICLRKSVDEPFTAGDHKKCIEKAMAFLPDDENEIVYEVVVKQDIECVAGGERELQTVIYWKGQ